MAFAITDFKSNLTGGGARSSLFNVTVSFPTSITGEVSDTDNTTDTATATTSSARMKFLVSATSIPASTLTTYDIFYHGKALKVASDRTFDAWETTIINDEDFLIRNDIEKWIDSISKPDLNTRNTAAAVAKKEGTNAAYKSTGIVTQYGKNGTEIRKYKFLGLFPTILSTIALSWESSVIETYTCGWAYDSWEIG